MGEMSNISGDSGEYEVLAEAVEMTKRLDGICCEVGLRLGMGTKTIIDAVAEYCPNKWVVSIDPFGSILYTGREHVGPIRLDYTEQMRNECLGNMYPYVQSKQVHWKFIELTDEDFFEIYKDGVILYDHERELLNKYSMVHLDGPHSYYPVAHEVMWFNERMKSGAVIVIDDCSPDFIDIKPIQNLFDSIGWKEIKMGFKKGLWQKT